MSSIKLSPNASGTGEFTIAAPNSNTNRTLTLPDQTGTVLTSASSITQNAGPAFSAYLGSSQTITTATWTKLNINQEEFDTNSCYDSSTNYRFTPTVAGYYQINGKVLYDPIESGKISIVSIYKNGSRFKDGSRGLNNINSNGAASLVSSVVYLNGTTDYVELYTYNSNTTSASVASGSFETFFNAAMVRAA